MLRIAGQRGVLAAARATIKCRVLCRRFLTGDNDMLKEKQEASVTAGPKQQWASGDNDHFWNHVNKLDGRVDNLTKSPGDFKGDVNKSIGELSKAVGKGFGDRETRVDIAKLETKMGTEIAGLKYDSKVTKWQINLLFGGATADYNIKSIVAI